ncbi:hypothetical protein D3C71_1872870 [compost metagenome]
MFDMMYPMAGWSGGTLGNNSRTIGRSSRASFLTSPASSAMRMIPSQNTIMLMRPKETVTPVLAPSNTAWVTESILPWIAATIKPATRKKSHIQLTTGAASFVCPLT